MTKQALLCPRKNCGTASQPAVCSPANSSAAVAFLIFPTSNATHDCGTGRLSSHLSVPKPDSAACGNCQKAAEQIDSAILPKSLEARFKGFQWLELQRLAPVLVVSKKNPLAKFTKIHPEKLRDKMLLGLGADKYPEYVPRLKAILQPFGVKPQLRNHTSEDIAALFIAIEAQAGMAVLTEGILPMLPSTLAACRFSPELAPLLIAAGTPTLRPNPHSEAFLKILLEEINKFSGRKKSNA